MRAEALLLHSDYTGEIVKGKIKDGEFTFNYNGNAYTFSTAKIRPIVIKKLFFSVPLYIFKYSTQIPLAFVNRSEEGKEEFIPPEKILPILQAMGFKEKLDLLVKREYIEPVSDIAFYETEMQLSPKIAGETADMKFLQQLMKYVTEKPSMEIKKTILIVVGASILLFILFYALANPQAFRRILNI